MIKILHSEPFLPLGKAIPKPAPAAPKAVEIKPGIWQAPDGKLFTDLPEGSMSAPAKPLPTPVPLHTPTETPLPVVPNAAGSCWVEHDGVTPPADTKLLYDLQYQINGVDQHHEHQAVTRSFFIDGDGFKVLRYRIRVPQ